jgi:hypothetical protein
MLLRDEDDIIRQNLAHLLTWIDALYILDLGSTDSTWDIVQEFAAKDSRIVPFKHAPIVYNDSLRCMLFDHYRDRFEPGDWVMKIDADEFYYVTPPDFVRTRLRAMETIVILQWYFFRLTSREVANYDSGRVDVMEDRKRSIQDRRRFYKIAQYGEPRMFRYRQSMRWPESANWPFNAGYMSRERLPILHYPHRDPLQMERRYRLRAAMTRMKGSQQGSHWKLEDWRKEVIDVDADPTGTHESTKTGEGLSAVAGHAEGSLMHWAPGEPLHEVRTTSHLAPPGKRLVQRLIHPLLLPLLDRTRPQYSQTFQPTLIPDEINRQIDAPAATGG